MADDPSIPNVYGWDASNYDWQRGPMDLAAAARDGIQFFTHKATEGTSTRHDRYGEALRRARDAGIPVLGAYHVVRSAPSVSAQVDYFVSYMDSQTPWWRSWPDWFVQVDLEKWQYDAVPAYIGEAFADLVEQRTGRKAVIYASRGQYGNELNSTSHPLWNANYGTNIEDHYQDVYAARGGDSGPGWVTYSGRMPIIWQYGSRTRIGTQTICDANAFRGTLAQLKALVSGHPTPTGGDDPMLFQVKGRPEIYVPRGGGYVHMALESALNSMQAAGQTIIPLGSMAELEALLGKPYVEPLPTPVTLTPADCEAIAAAVAALLPAPPVPPTAQEIAKATLDEDHKRSAD